MIVNLKSIKRSKSGKIITTEDEYGWTTKIIYRDSMKDLVIKQYKKDYLERYIYLKPEECKLVLELLKRKSK